MSMSVKQEGGDEDVPMSDINTTPLVDVMLVLLIIFLITVPVVIQTIPVKLPKVRYEVTQTKPENVSLSVNGLPDGSCGVYWNMTKMTSKELLDRAVTNLKAQVDKVGTSAATSTRRTAVSAGRSTRCSLPVSPRLASFRSRAPVARSSVFSLGAYRHGDANHRL
jgi:biopolymer transport protein ExbD